MFIQIPLLMHLFPPEGLCLLPKPFSSWSTPFSISPNRSLLGFGSVQTSFRLPSFLRLFSLGVLPRGQWCSLCMPGAWSLGCGCVAVSLWDSPDHPGRGCFSFFSGCLKNGLWPNLSNYIKITKLHLNFLYL